jgi:hypothetical protein
MKTKAFDFQELAESWLSPLVARREMEKFTGGALRPRTLANLDSSGEGPPVRVVIGRAVCYPARELCIWLEERTRKAGI